MLDFSDKSKTDWPGREDFKVIDYIDVDVIRLDSLIIEYKMRDKNKKGHQVPNYK
jgi:hypothetical protein